MKQPEVLQATMTLGLVVVTFAACSSSGTEDESSPEVGVAIDCGHTVSRVLPFNASDREGVDCILEAWEAGSPARLLYGEVDSGQATVSVLGPNEVLIDDGLGMEFGCSALFLRNEIVVVGELALDWKDCDL